MDMQIFVIDLDGSVASQPFLKALAGNEAHVIPARDLGPPLRLVSNRKALQTLRQRLRDSMGPLQQDRLEVVFYGSGDFHHLCTCLLERHVEPITVVHIDNHPDWVTFPPTLNCGSWVNHALKHPNVAQVITLGPAGDDLQWPELKAGNLRAVQEGRLKIRPWRPTSSKVMRHYGDTASWRQVGSRLEWFDEDHLSFAQASQEMVRSLTTDAVYITIDKDALVTTQAATNWDQGRMMLADIQSLLHQLALSKRIVGIDVCGDHSIPEFRDLFRRLISFFDRDDVQPGEEGRIANSATNAALVAMIAALPQRASNAIGSRP